MGVKVVVVSDTHITEQAPAFGDNWRAVRDWIGETAPEVVVHLGDITAHGVDDARELDHAREAFDAVGREIRFVPGNHDIGDSPCAPDRPSEHPLDWNRLAHYRKIFGPDRWSLPLGSWRLVGLDAQLFGTASAEEQEQFAWLDETVRQHRGPLGVMLHKPLFRDDPAETIAHVRYVPAAPRRRLLDCLAGCDLRFVASGHAHQARRLRVGSIEHAWAPSLAYRIPDAVQERIGEKVVGVLALELDEAGHRFEVVVPDGVIQHDLADHPHLYHEIGARQRPNGFAAL